MKSYRNGGDRQQVYQRRDRFSNSDYTNNSPRKLEVLEMSLNECKKRVHDLENKLKTIETDYQNHMSKNQANSEDLKKRVEVLEQNQNKFSSSSTFFQQFDDQELKIFGNIVSKIQNMIRDSQKPAGSSTPEENIIPHCNFVMDDEDRAIVYVKSKIVNTGENGKAAFGIWWAAGHEGNVERVVTSANVTENSVNLQAIICAMETAIRFKMQRLCVVSDAKYVIGKMIDRFPESPGEDSSQWKVFLLQPVDERDLFQYAYEMTTWFYDIKWSYTDNVKNLPGMQDALKLINNCLSD